jgi:hypothetical protein
MGGLIPAFLEIDAEPDESALEIGARPWTGFESIVDFIDGLRAPLAERSGVEPHPSWFFRMDPAIELCFGRADYAFHQHRASIDRLIASGDQFGIHVHPHRWDPEREHIFTDHTDPQWVAHCVRSAADAFEAAVGERPRRSSVARFISEPAVDALVESGIKVDFTVEPGLAPIPEDRGFGVNISGLSTDFRGFPRCPYRVSTEGLGQPASSSEDARALVEVPRTTYDYRATLARFRSRVKTKVLRRSAPLPLNPWEGIVEPHAYWDLVQRAMEESPLPYLALAIRADRPERPSHQTVRTVLTALTEHPLSKRVAFVDPLVLADLPAGAPNKRWARNAPTLESATAQPT